ncbi:tannase and feruloyl esterase-domain-containing protein [Corynascus similis CBS 632.67]
MHSFNPPKTPAYQAVSTERLSCGRESFSGILPVGATLEEVSVVHEGGSYGEGAANIPYPRNPTNLPALCAVTIQVWSSPTTSYRFGLFLPDEWNSRLLVVGNGGFAGGINWMDMAAGPHYGMASLSTDTGHNSTAIDASWALNQPERKTDWGWRAMHGSTVLGKQLVRAYYSGQALTYSYFSGCSIGGRQGLKELQNFPDSFDGALIGAPAWWTSHLHPYFIRAFLYNYPPTGPGRLSNADVSLLADEVIGQCDHLDGVRDGIVSKPELCNPNFSTLLCPTTTSRPNRSCLTPAQLTTAYNMYSPWLSSRNTSQLLYPGLTPGSEHQWHLLLNGTEPSPYGLTYDWRTFNESIAYLADALDPGDATADDYAALAAVRDRGGKIVLWHGMADGLIPTKGSEVYFNRTVEALSSGNGGINDFFRMFLISGLQHCWNTAVDAPWHIGGAFQSSIMGSSLWSVPGFEDAEHDALLALVDWVEKGRPVDQIIATTWNSPMNPSSGVRRQRPICPWPRYARHGLLYVEVDAI